MFTPADFNGYFKEIKRIEDMMINIDRKLLALKPNKEITKLIEIIQKDEFKHSRMAKEIIEMV